MNPPGLVAVHDFGVHPGRVSALQGIAWLLAFGSVIACLIAWGCSQAAGSGCCIHSGVELRASAAARIAPARLPNEQRITRTLSCQANSIASLSFLDLGIGPGAAGARWHGRFYDL